MKLEDLLMQPGEEKQPKTPLQEQVGRLKKELDSELEVKRVLQCAMKGPVTGCCQSCSSLSTLLPFKVQMILAEVALVEEEIRQLERKIHELKLNIYQEKNQTKQWDNRQLKEKRRPHNKISSERRASFGSFMELQAINSLEKYGKLNMSFFSAMQKEEEGGNSRYSTRATVHTWVDNDVGSESVNANKLSVELIKCLMGIFLRLNQTTYKSKGATNLTKGLVCKAAFSCRTPVFPFGCNNVSQLDPYDILPQSDVNIRDVGVYRSFVQITRSTLDVSRLSECLPDMRRLRVLMQKLSRVNINNFTHKQKLAFWINVYNAALMNAFLQGLPSTQEKLLGLKNEAGINVGGFMFKASTIEQFILRHPVDIKQESIDEKELLLRHTCGLGYPEPNVTFALCRGSWSSPALRFYTPDEVMNELESAKIEYLEASIGITSRKKILVPKLMIWHMKDFADDMESLLEWIYSQLPYTSSLKRLMMECLNGETQSPSQKLIEIQPYVTEFRYLILV